MERTVKKGMLLETRIQVLLEPESPVLPRKAGFSMGPDSLLGSLVDSIEEDLLLKLVSPLTDGEKLPT